MEALPLELPMLPLPALTFCMARAPKLSRRPKGVVGLLEAKALEPEFNRETRIKFFIHARSKSIGRADVILMNSWRRSRAVLIFFESLTRAGYCGNCDADRG